MGFIDKIVLFNLLFNATVAFESQKIQFSFVGGTPKFCQLPLCPIDGTIVQL